MNVIKTIGSVLECVAVALAVTGCVSGPDFKQPSAPLVESITAMGANAETVSSEGIAGGAQRFVGDMDIPSAWWSLFRSEALDQLVRQALDASPTLAQSRARLGQAQEAFNAESGATKYPTVDLGLSAKRQKVNLASSGLSGVENPSPFALYNASVSVSYTFDLFGKNRRTLEMLEADVEHRAFELTAARETLAANVVLAAIHQAALNRRIDCVSNLLSVQTSQLAILDAQFEAGGISTLALETHQLLISQTRALLPPLEHQVVRINHQIGVYLDRLPSEASIVKFDLDFLHLPEELPLSLPSELVRRRPDIRASEALWHKACAGLGVATADLYPQVTLSGNLGSQQTTVSDVFNSLNVWSLGAGMVQPIFRGGALRAKKREAGARYDEAAAVYRQTVLKSFQEVADALHALDSDARSLRDRSETVRHARNVFEIASKQFEAGAISHLALLDVQTQLMQAELEQVQAQADRYADSAVLLHALGGGWWQEGRNP